MFLKQLDQAEIPLGFLGLRQNNSLVAHAINIITQYPRTRFTSRNVGLGLDLPTRRPAAGRVPTGSIFLGMYQPEVLFGKFPRRAFLAVLH